MCAQIPAVQLFLAVINVVLVLQRLPCATSQLACMPVILAFCLLALEVRPGPWLVCLNLIPKPLKLPWPPACWRWRCAQGPGCTCQS